MIHPEQANVSKERLREELAKRYKAETRNIICYGFRTQFGGGKSTGFALIYDSHQYLLKYEPKFRIRKVISSFLHHLLQLNPKSLESSPNDPKPEKQERK